MLSPWECGRLSAHLPGTRIVSLMERGGNAFALFAWGVGSEVSMC